MKSLIPIILTRVRFIFKYKNSRQHRERERLPFSAILGLSDTCTIIFKYKNSRQQRERERERETSVQCNSWPFAVRKVKRPWNWIPETKRKGIPGDGRCLFRSVVHGACLREGKPPPSESRQRELADELRDKVADEFIKRRADTEWFLEDDFETYVVQMRQPHIWGGEPELLMSSHVLKTPITVYMRDKNSGSLKIIAEYGQEYGKDNPIRVLYNGYGHYDALRSPTGGAQPKMYRFW